MNLMQSISFLLSVDLKRDNNDKIICATWCAGEMCSWNHRHWAQQAAGEALTWDLHSCHMGARTLWCHWCRVMWNDTISKHRNNDIKTLSVCICTSYTSISHEFLNLVRSWRAKKKKPSQKCLNVYEWAPLRVCMDMCVCVVIYIKWCASTHRVFYFNIWSSPLVSTLSIFVGA